MKKLIIIGVAIVALLGALVSGLIYFYRNNVPAAPTTEPSIETTVPPQSTTAPTQTTAPPIQVELQSPMVSISLPILKEIDTADNAEEIFLRTFQDVVLNMTDASVARSITLDILKRMDKNSVLLSSIQSGAYADYTGQDQWIPYFYKLLYCPQRIDPTVLSLFGEETSYNGAQSGHIGISVTYNLLSGTALKLSDVLTEENSAAENLLTAVLAALEAKETEYMLFEYYADTVTNRFQKDLLSESGWFFSAEGLNLFYEPYEIAPNAAGIVVATVPYSDLRGILLDVYFPAEQAAFGGTIHSTPFADADLSVYQSFAELVTHTDAPQYILSTNGALYDMTVEQGSWIGNSRYESEGIIFRANHLCPEDALVLRTQLPTQQSPLRISFHNGSEAFCFYLTLDSATGNITFTPAE